MKNTARTVALLCVSSALGCTALACTAQNLASHPVAARAPADLDCPKDDVHYRRLEDKLIMVKGCGRTATYVEQCQERFNAAASATLGMPTSSETCEWVPRDEDAPQEGN